MKIFISWSGDLSNKVAVTLKDWIPNINSTFEPHVSSEDIDKGRRWSNDIGKELENTSCGIVCVTKDNFKAPWLNFEAGALSKKLDSSRVCPFLFNVKRSEIEGPLIQFQVTANTKEDIFKLVTSLNKLCPEYRLTDERLKKIFEIWWPELEETLNNIDTQNGNDNDSINNIYNDKILEEILSLVQTQHKIIRRPEELLPPDYIIKAFEDAFKKSPSLKPACILSDSDSTFAKIYFDLIEKLDFLSSSTLKNLDFVKSFENIDPEIIANASKIHEMCKAIQYSLQLSNSQINKTDMPIIILRSPDSTR